MLRGTEVGDATNAVDRVFDEWFGSRCVDLRDPKFFRLRCERIGGEIENLER